MKLIQSKHENDRWMFTGRIPMELARKTWPDKYAAVQAAEKSGFVVFANGNCSQDTGTTTRVKSEDGLGSRPRCPDCGEEGEMKGHMSCQYPQD